MLAERVLNHGDRVYKVAMNLMTPKITDSRETVTSSIAEGR
jgi:hypothetical protein